MKYKSNYWNNRYLLVLSFSSSLLFFLNWKPASHSQKTRLSVCNQKSRIRWAFVWLTRLELQKGRAGPKRPPARSWGLEGPQISCRLIIYKFLFLGNWEATDLIHLISFSISTTQNWRRKKEELAVKI